MPEILFGKLDNFALLSIPMFIIMGASIASTRAGADLYEALERWLTRVPGGLVVSNLGACALFAAMSAPARQPVPPSARWASPRCASAAIRTASRRALSPRAAHSAS
jgi:TRAP-type C4-dicarboxylate transport system permease large subunit